MKTTSLVRAHAARRPDRLRKGFFRSRWRMSDTLLAERILTAIEATTAEVDAEAASSAAFQDAKRERLCAAIEQTLAADLGLAELKRAVAQLTQNLETASPFERAEVRAAAARALRVLAALRL